MRGVEPPSVYIVAGTIAIPVFLMTFAMGMAISATDQIALMHICLVAEIA